MAAATSGTSELNEVLFLLLLLLYFSSHRRWNQFSCSAEDIESSSSSSTYYEHECNCPDRYRGSFRAIAVVGDRERREREWDNEYNKQPDSRTNKFDYRQIKKW